MWRFLRGRAEAQLDILVTLAVLWLASRADLIALGLVALMVGFAMLTARHLKKQKYIQFLLYLEKT